MTDGQLRAAHPLALRCRPWLKRYAAHSPAARSVPAASAA